MKMRRDMVTGIVGLLTCVFFCFMTLQVRQPAKLLEPGPRLLPFVALFLIGISSIALIIRGYKDRAKEESPTSQGRRAQGHQELFDAGALRRCYDLSGLCDYHPPLLLQRSSMTSRATARSSRCPPLSSRWW